MNRRLVKVIVWSVALVAAGAALLPLLARTTNCGGNCAALSSCKQILIYDQWARGTNNACFDVAKLDTVDHTNFFLTVANHWTADAGYWLRTNGLGNGTARQIVVVCDRAYDNVPQPTVWNLYRRNPAHAVGYSDGATGLITPVEFEALDRRAFISLTALATNQSR